MKNPKGMTALVTGASMGIGLEFSKILASMGTNLVIASRNLDKLNEVKNELEKKYSIKVTVIPADLSSPGGPQKLFSECNSKNIKIDILINNAGMGLFGEVTATDPKDTDKMLQLNINALTALSSLFAAQMKASKAGMILNVASLAALFPIPYFAAYSASKSYVLSFTHSLRAELSGSGVSVTSLLPGYVRTNFDAAANIKETKYLEMSKKIGMSAEKVAMAGIRAMLKRKASVIAGTSNKISAFFVGLLPKSWMAGIVRLFMSGMVKK